MITTKKIETVEDFQNLKKGDLVACEFHRDTYKKGKRTRFASYIILENKSYCKEIILEKQCNVYFNYEMFLMGDSNLKSILLLLSDCVQPA